mgnify:CR=1 FL=1
MAFGAQANTNRKDSSIPLIFSTAQRKAEFVRNRSTGWKVSQWICNIVSVDNNFVQLYLDGSIDNTFNIMLVTDIYQVASQMLLEDDGTQFDVDKYLNAPGFASRLPEKIKSDIRLHGIRNSHLLSVAPTGTVSLAFADNASNGIEPPFSWFYKRKKREKDGSTKEYMVEDHAWRLYKEMGGDVDHLPDYFVTALEMTAEDHLAMMKTVQPFIDTAISKTVNVPADYPYDSFKDLYFQAWKSNLKGLATYRPNNILGAVLEVVKPESDSSGEIHEPHKNELLPISKKVIEKRPNGELPAVAEKISYWTQDGKKTLYLIISFMAVEGVVNGQKCLEERAIEFFMPVGQSGESQQWITSSMRLLSLAARGGFLSRALSDMRKVVWDRGPVRLGTKQKLDGTEVPMWHDSEVAAVAYAIEKILQRRKISEFGTDLNGELMEVSSSNVISGRKCSDCGAHTLIKKDGCDYCTSCGFVGSCG